MTSLQGITKDNVMKSLNESWSLFCSKLEKVKTTSNGIEALCPAHDDKKASLTASRNGEKILVNCQAGCSFDDISSAIRMEQSQFFAPKEITIPKKIEAVYRYEDKDGNHVMDVVRFKPKGFRPRRPDGKLTLEGVTRVPYRLPQMLAAIKEGKDILVLEGEKDCDNAKKIGLVTTTFPGGTGKWSEEYSKWFKEAKVICIPDNDSTGRDGMDLIASKIIKVAKSVRWLELPDIPEKGDLTDWLEVKDNSHTKFQELIDKSTEWNKETKEESLVVLTLNELLNKKITPRQYLLSPWLQSQGLCMIYSTRGFGKTWVSLEIAYAVATGGQFLSWKSDNPTGVLYIDGETALGDLQNRVKQIDMRVGNKLQTPLKFLSRDAQEADFPNLSTAEGQRQIESLIRDDIKLVILDNISTLFRSGKEYESDSWLPIQNWLLSLRSLGKSVLLIHHAGKGGQQRGTSRREDVLDTIISLKRPTDYKEEEGARIEFHFEKSRSLLGDEVKPFEARLESKVNNEGIQVHKWTWKSLKDSTYESVLRLANEGLDNWEIAQDLDIHKSTVSRYVQSGKGKGAIKPQNN